MITVGLIAASVATAAAMAWLALHAPGRKPSRTHAAGSPPASSRAPGDLPAAFRPGPRDGRHGS